VSVKDLVQAQTELSLQTPVKMSLSPAAHKSFSHRRTIRKKLLIATIVFGVVVAILGYSSLRGVYAYRDLAAMLSHRANEFPITSKFTQQVDEMRYAFGRIRDNEPTDFGNDDRWGDRWAYQYALNSSRETLELYKLRLNNIDIDSPYLSDTSPEQIRVKKITKLLDQIVDRYRGNGMVLDATSATVHAQQLSELSNLAHELPTFLGNRMANVRDHVRAQYRTWIALTWSSFAIAALLLSGLVVFARLAVIRPFKKLLEGARIVASGKFEHSIDIDSEDEIAELAFVINRGTKTFLDIQNDLNHEVMARSQEVIRNEQLASVGFLAAGVAHEINNPLASIAWSAEALESRLHRILHPIAEKTGVELPELETLKTYLKRIQDEAFRCKGITERLLDFSRLSQVERKQATDMVDVVNDVIELVRHLGQYRNSHILFEHDEEATAWASPQEMKQVVLNLLTNSLDALLPDTPDQVVHVSVRADRQSISLVIEDNGCGMTDEVRAHLFEPFFTRRRDGRGTGLGLPITSRIIADHCGRIVVSSRGVNLGSKFEVIIPTVTSHTEHESKQQQTLAIASAA
jgi:signal transduction histidine kinase